MRKSAAIAVVLGTRPEAIKLAPVIRVLLADDRFNVRVIATGQHAELLERALDDFSLTVDQRLAVMTADQSLAALSGRLIEEINRSFTLAPPDAVIVQGDTTTAFCAALVAHYHRVPVAHVEAGLRTGDRYAPFPEEVNRRLIADLATWHFAPGDRHRVALIAEGIEEAQILVTGNTIADAVRLISSEHTRFVVPDQESSDAPRIVLVTAHRREHHGDAIRSICRAIKAMVEWYPDIAVIWPVHPNPHVRSAVHAELDSVPRVLLTEPMPYPEFLHILMRSVLVISDSGGVQEEAGLLGIPLIVTRNATERQEVIEAGGGILSGADEQGILDAAAAVLDRPVYGDGTARKATTMFGDGYAAERIVAFLAEQLGVAT